MTVLSKYVTDSWLMTSWRMMWLQTQCSSRKSLLSSTDVSTGPHGGTGRPVVVCLWLRLSLTRHVASSRGHTARVWLSRPATGSGRKELEREHEQHGLCRWTGGHLAPRPASGRRTISTVSISSSSSSSSCSSTYSSAFHEPSPRWRWSEDFSSEGIQCATADACAVVLDVRSTSSSSLTLFSIQSCSLVWNWCVLARYI